jgi:hypothetical protein
MGQKVQFFRALLAKKSLKEENSCNMIFHHIPEGVKGFKGLLSITFFLFYATL